MLTNTLLLVPVAPATNAIRSRGSLSVDQPFPHSLTADTLIGGAGNDLFFPGQLGWQLLSAGMLACRRRFQWQR